MSSDWEKIGRTAVAVPATFGLQQKSEVQIAAFQSTGTEVISLICAPCAIAVAHAPNNDREVDRGNSGVPEGSGETVLVVDLGKNKLEVTLLYQSTKYLRVLAAAEHTRLGIEKFYDVLGDYCLKTFNRTYSLDVKDVFKDQNFQESAEWKKLREVCEAMVLELSHRDKSRCNIELFFGQKNLSLEISRKEFENLASDLWIQATNLIEDLLRTSRYSSDEVGTVLLVGETCKLPNLRTLVTNMFDKNKVRVEFDEHDAAVSRGMDIMAWSVAPPKELDYTLPVDRAILKILDHPMTRRSEVKDPRTFLIFDFGRKSLKVTCLSLNKERVQVQAYDEDTNLGGETIDELLADHVLHEFRCTKAADDPEVSCDWLSLKKHVERAKIQLSENETARVQMENLNGGRNLTTTIKRETFEKLTKQQYIRACIVVEDLFHQKGIKMLQKEAILLVGGTTRIEAMKSALKSTFSQAINLLDVPDKLKDTLRLLADQAAFLIKTIKPRNVSESKSTKTKKMSKDIIKRDLEDEEGTNKDIETVAPVDSCEIIGIDLGTSNSSVGIISKALVEILSVAYPGKINLPSYVAFDNLEEENFEIMIGDEAKTHMHYETVVYWSKRLLGRNFNDPFLQKVISRCTFIMSQVTGRPKYEIQVDGLTSTYFPEEISALVLLKLKKKSENHLDTKVGRAVISVPVHFTLSQKQATRTAARLAGLEVVTLLPEPTASAIAYTKDAHLQEKDGNILVFDLGAGTLDISMFKVTKGSFQVLAVGGDPCLGGVDFDNVLADYLLNIINNRLFLGTDKLEKDNKFAWRRLLNLSENSKISLSSHIQANISLDNIVPEINLNASVTRASLEMMAKELMTKVMSATVNVVKSSEIRKEDIEKVILVGGSTRIPAVIKMLEDYFGQEKLYDKMREEAVARGATIMGALKSLTNASRQPTLQAPSQLYRLLEGDQFSMGRRQNVLVFHFGSQLLDVAVISVTSQHYELLANRSDINKGGEKVDLLLAGYMWASFNGRPQYNREPAADMSFQSIEKASERLKSKAKVVKEKLSLTYEVEFELFSLSRGEDLDMIVDIGAFEKLTNSFFCDVMDEVRELLRESGLTKNQIDKVVLLGGNTKIPKIREMLINHFGQEKMITDITTEDKMVLRNLILEASRLAETVKDVPYEEQLSLSIGHRAANGNMVFLLKRNTLLPAKMSKTFTNKDDNQEVLIIKLYEGENEVAENNSPLGEVRVILSPLPAKSHKISFTLDVEKDGSWTVTTSDPDHTSVSREYMGMTEEEIQISMKKMRVIEEEMNV